MILLEEKIFNLMEKMYGEMQKGFNNLRSEMQHGFTETNKRLDNLEERQGKLEKQAAQIENDLKPKIEAALDGYNLVYEKLEVLEKKSINWMQLSRVMTLR
jgi:tetrahydromethanopterin S-methyltransferase subunit G